LSQQRRV